MKQFTLVLAALMIAVFVTACSNTTAVRTSNEKFDKTKSGDVQILTIQPDRPFQEIGTLNTSGWKEKDTKKMYDEFRKEAAAMGGHAVLLTETGVQGRKDDQQWARAAVIRFTEPAAEADAGDGA